MNQNYQQIEVTRTYLEMTDSDEINSKDLTNERIEIKQINNCSASFYRYLYREVGRQYYWCERLNWSDRQIDSHLAQPQVTLCVMYCNCDVAGYFELKQHNNGSIELAYFGLLPEFIGCGLGKYLLTKAVKNAWIRRANRVWVHTCTLDHQAALPNYLKRGFKVYKEEAFTISIPA